MATSQTGYLGRTGPTFVDDTTVSGKKVMYQGTRFGNKMYYQVKQPDYAKNVLGGSVSDYALGNYQDNQVLGEISSWKQPASGNAFDGYSTLANDWATGTFDGVQDHGTAPSTGGSTTTPSTGGTTTTPSTGGTTTGGTVTTGGTTTDTTYKAPTMSEQISTFLSNYWWLVLLILAVVLYKPVIAPALGLDKKARKYR